MHVNQPSTSSRGAFAIRCSDQREKKREIREKTFVSKGIKREEEEVGKLVPPSPPQFNLSLSPESSRILFRQRNLEGKRERRRFVLYRITIYQIRRLQRGRLLWWSGYTLLRNREKREREREREEQRRKTRIEVRMKQKLVKGEENFPNSEWSEEGNVKSSWQTCFPPFILFLPNLDSYLDLFVSLRADPRKGFVVSPNRIEGERRGRVYQRRGGVNLRIGDFNKIKICRDNCLMFLFLFSLSLCAKTIFFVHPSLKACVS